MEQNLVKGNILEMGEDIGKVIVIGNTYHNNNLYSLVCKMSMEEKNTIINTKDMILFKVENDQMYPETDIKIVEEVVQDIIKNENK